MMSFQSFPDRMCMNVSCYADDAVLYCYEVIWSYKIAGPKKKHFISKIFSSTSIEAELCFLASPLFKPSYFRFSPQSCSPQHKDEFTIQADRNENKSFLLKHPVQWKSEETLECCSTTPKVQMWLFFFFVVFCFYRHREVLVGRRCGTTHVL